MFPSSAAIVLPLPQPRGYSGKRGDSDGWRGPRSRGPQFLPKCRKTFCSFLSMSSWSWDRRSAYCCCLIFWTMASASWSKDTARPPVRPPRLRQHQEAHHHPPARRQGPGAPEAAPDPGPRAAQLVCLSAQLFYKENPAKVVKHQPMIIQILAVPDLQRDLLLSHSDF